MAGLSQPAVITPDLVRAFNRSETVPKDWDAAMLNESLRRYQMFLLLAAKYPGTGLAPTRDIDVMWHLHMLHPLAYYQDCQRLFGTILDHDGGFGADPSELPELKETFRATARLWEATFGEPYVRAEHSPEITNCWHDCQGRCHHACKSTPA